MADWAWGLLALGLAGWVGTGWWAFVIAQRLLARTHAHAITTAEFAALTRAYAHLEADQRQTLAAWAAEVARTREDWRAAVAQMTAEAAALRADGQHLRTTLDQSLAQVTALSHATALSQAAIQARTDWANAFNRNFNPACDLDPVPPKGWQCVLLGEGGAVESIRTIRDGNAPTRIPRQHGDHSDWYRLVRVDGLSLLYEPEMSPH